MRAVENSCRHHGFQYDLEVDDGKTRSVTARNQVASPELQALLDVLLPLARPE